MKSPTNVAVIKRSPGKAIIIEGGGQKVEIRVDAVQENQAQIRVSTEGPMTILREELVAE